MTEGTTIRIYAKDRERLAQLQLQRWSDSPGGIRPSFAELVSDALDVLIEAEQP